MAGIPDYTRQIGGQTARATTAVQVSTNADTFGAGVGRAVSNASASVDHAVNTVAALKTLKDEAAAREAFEGYRKDHRNALLDPDEGYLTRTGKHGMDVVDAAQNDLKTSKDKHGESLTGAARRAYDARVAELQDQGHKQLLTHSANETRNYLTNQRKSSVDNHLEDAATNWADPELFERSVALAHDEQDKLAQLEGWDAETTAKSRDALTSSAHRQRIVQAAAKDPIAAAALLEGARDQLSAEDEYALDQNLEGLVYEAKAQKFAEGFITRGMVGGAPRTRKGVRGGDHTGAKFDGKDRSGDGVKVEFNMGPSRANAPNQEIIDVVAHAAEATFGKGTRVVITSGAEDHGKQHGSNRHRTGFGADVAIYRPDGTRVQATDADAAQFARASATAGALGIGFGEGYMSGEHFHVDMVLPAGGQAHTWGKQGSEMRAELTALMGAGTSATLKKNGIEDTIVNRVVTEKLGEELGVKLIHGAMLTPASPAKWVLPDQLMRDNPKFAGMTIGEVYDTMATTLGDTPSVRGGAPYFDAQAAYQEALNIEDPKMRDAAVKQIEALAVIQDRARNAGRTQAQDEAWDEYTRTGRTDFPLAMRQAMGQAGWQTFKAVVKSDESDADETDIDTWETLTRTAIDEPKKFAELNLKAHYANLSEADRRHFVVMQETTAAQLEDATTKSAKALETAKNSIDYPAIYKEADNIYKALIDPATEGKQSQEQRQRVLDFQKQLNGMVKDFWAAHERQPDATEVRDMASVLALPVQFNNDDKGMLGNLGAPKGNLFDAAQRGDNQSFELTVEYDDIPQAERARIAGQLMATNGGKVPRSDEIVEVFEQRQLRSAGLAAPVDIKTVPAWLIDAERGANPKATDDEIVAVYQRYLSTR